MRAERLRKRPRIVEDRPYGVGHNLPDGTRVLVVIEKVRRDPRRPSYREPSEPEPVPPFQSSAVEPNVWSPRLLSLLNRELVDVRR
jgi:hypothetical protein